MSTSILPNTLEKLPIEVGVFSTVEAARNAVVHLLEAGFTAEQISVVCSDEKKEGLFREFEHQKPAGTTTAKATVIGGSIGAAIGGLAVIGTAVATGSATLWAAGPIFAWTGGIAGGLVGAMMTRGIEKELANFYQQAVIDGDLLVAVEDHHKDQTRLAKAAQIFAGLGAVPMPLREG